MLTLKITNFLCLVLLFQFFKVNWKKKIIFKLQLINYSMESLYHRFLYFRKYFTFEENAVQDCQ